MPSPRHFILGVDIGGTFTDFVGAADGEDALFVHKRLTTPEDPTEAVFAGIDRFESDCRIAGEDRLTLVHATTLATNLVLERKGARVALVTTRGFRDLLTMRRESRYDDYDLELAFPDPLVPRALRFEVAERTLASGEIALAPDPGDLREIADRIRAAGVEAVAICLLHSYANPANERAVAAALQANGCALPLSLSSVVQPEIREYERCSTTVLNAYVQPGILQYLARFETRLAAKPYAARLYIMQSNGGYADGSLSGELPARLVESGPAAGTIAAAYFARQTGRRRAVAFDMGGTTAKVAAIRDFTPEIAPELEVARVHRVKKGSGMPLRCPSVELIEIGSGGGSIAHLDRLKRLCVGPESAGSAPGPACYGRGGTGATVTDADLVLGYLDAAAFPFPLSIDRAKEAIRSGVAEPLGVDPVVAAWGIVELVTEQMAAATRIQLLEKGLDAREFSLVAFGGAGPVHACSMARRLGIRSIVYPVAAGVASAFGLLTAPNASLASRTFIRRLDALDERELAALVGELREETVRQMNRGGEAPARPEYALFLDMRYAKQGYEIAVEVPAEAQASLDAARIATLFAGTYGRVFGRAVEGVAVEIVGVRLIARSPSFARLSAHAGAATADGAAPPGRRRIYLLERRDFVDCEVLTRGALRLRGSAQGPLVVQDPETSIVLDAGATARVDEFGHVIAELA